MKVTCPECSVVVEIPGSILGDGRRVRCAACSHVWFQSVETAEPGAFGGFRSSVDDMVVEPIPASVHPGQDIPDEVSHDDGGPSFLSRLTVNWINWGYLGRMVGGFAVVLVVGFGGILTLAKAGLTLSAFNSVYAAFGMDDAIEGDGLALRDVGVEGAVVHGVVVNTATGNRFVPALEIITVSHDGSESEATPANVENNSLKADESTIFSQVLPAAPESGEQIHVRFAH